MDIITGATIGQRKRISAAFSDADGPHDPTTVVLEVEDPDGLTTLPAPAHDGTGAYHYDLDLTADGPYTVRFAGTGTVPTAGEVKIVVDRSPFFD